MINFRTDIDALNMPWVESPFFPSLIEQADLSNEAKKQLFNFHSKGYIIVDLELDDHFINGLVEEYSSLLRSDNLKTNSTFFSYNESPRIVDAGKSCNKVVELALNQKVISTLKLLYRKNPIPFSTINFIKGTEQPLHSDTIHFGTIPKGFLTACWVALEDIDKNNGPLQIVEGSHMLKDVDYYDLKIKPARNTKLCEDIYRNYENYVNELISIKGMDIKKISMKKGHCIIWSANLLHGGSKINSIERTRYSQVTHYNFEGCDYYYHPFFSVPPLGKYIVRDLEKFDIRNFKV